MLEKCIYVPIIAYMSTNLIAMLENVCKCDWLCEDLSSEIIKNIGIYSRFLA